MDSDFTHPPETIRSLLDNAEDFDVVVGSRYMLANSPGGMECLLQNADLAGAFYDGFFSYVFNTTPPALCVYTVWTRYRVTLLTWLLRRGIHFYMKASLSSISINSPSKKFIKLPARTYGHSKNAFCKDARQS